MRSLTACQWPKSVGSMAVKSATRPSVALARRLAKRSATRISSESSATTRKIRSSPFSRPLLLRCRLSSAMGHLRLSATSAAGGSRPGPE